MDLTARPELNGQTVHVLEYVQEKDKYITRAHRGAGHVASRQSLCGPEYLELAPATDVIILSEEMRGRKATIEGYSANTGKHSVRLVRADGSGGGRLVWLRPAECRVAALYAYGLVTQRLYESDAAS